MGQVYLLETWAHGKADFPEKIIHVDIDKTQLGKNFKTAFQFPMEFGTLGYTAPAAIGAKFAAPGKNIIGITGDGGFLFTSQELSVALQHKLDLVLLMFNDNDYGSVKCNQKQTFNGRTAGVDLLNPDFMQYAKAFGIKGIRVEDLKEFKGILSKAVEEGGITLIEIPSAEFLNTY